MSDLLRIEGLQVVFDTFNGPVTAVSDASLQVAPGEVLGIVGESGCGKSVTVNAAMGLWPIHSANVTAKTLTVLGEDCRNYKESQWQAVRGTEVAMIFQDPMTALNPIVSIGDQIGEVIRLRRHRRNETDIPVSVAQEALELMRQVGIPEPGRRLKQYPHELSGGMRQRVVIAMTLAGKPKLLLADEPTTALDVTTEAQILQLLKNLVDEKGLGLIIISHNLRVIARLCDRVAVMYAGRVVEEGTIEDILQNPAHPYLKGLLASLPDGLEHGELTAIAGQPPDSYHMPPGCAFHPRCASAMRICARELPPTVTVPSATVTSDGTAGADGAANGEAPSAATVKSGAVHSASCWLFGKEEV